MHVADSGTLIELISSGVLKQKPIKRFIIIIDFTYGISIVCMHLQLSVATPILK
jgi:hypothetical protein